MSTSSIILQSYLSTFDSTKDKTEERHYAAKVDALLKFKDNDVLTPLNYYLGILENTERVMFRYMNAVKKELLLRDLQITYLLLLTQKKYEQQHQKYENLKSYDSLAQKCAELINELNYEQYCKNKEITPAPHHGQATEGQPVQYLGIYWGQCFSEQMVGLMDREKIKEVISTLQESATSSGQWIAEKAAGVKERQTKTIKEAMGSLNDKRLYWVWGSSLLKAVLEIMPEDFFNVDQAKQTVRTPDPYTGYLSWILYYFRFSLNLGLLLKHTISGPWMSEEEKSIPWTERFLTQWDQRKFTLLNDSIWGLCNMVTFLWLTGKGLLGTLGDMLTIALLVLDISITVWDFEEQKTKFNKEMLEYEKHIRELNDLCRKPKSDSETDEEYRKRIQEYQRQLLALQRAQAQCQREWDFAKIGLINNISYAVGLILAFVLLTAPFFPVAGAALSAIVVTGAVLCFAFTVIYNAVKGGIEIYKAQQSVKETKQHYQHKINELKELIRLNPDLKKNEQKLLFLEIKQLAAETDFQRQKVVLQTMHLVRSILFEALLPTVIFASFVFLPLGIGFGVLGAVLALAILSHFAINKLFTPEKEPLPEFDEKEYSVFCKNIMAQDAKSPKSVSFFNSSEEDQPTLDNGATSHPASS